MKPNIVIILMDTLRKDAFDKWLSEYNGEYKSIIENSFIFDNARSPSSWTLPSHMSLFTGLYPSEHEIHELGDKSRILDVIKTSREYTGKTLMDLARKNGYYTSGFATNPTISYSGIPDHFNNFVHIKSKSLESVSKFRLEALLSKEDLDKYLQIKSNVKKAQFLIKKHPLKSTVYISGELLKHKGYRDPTYKNYKEILDSFIASAHFTVPQFMFFNFMEMHEPYIKNVEDLDSQIEHIFGYKKLNNAKLKKMKEIYFAQAGKITPIFDAIISKLIDEKQLDNSIVIITSDHGQGFNENGYVGHGIYNYDEISRIPLFIYAHENLIKQRTSDKHINTGLVNLFDFLKDIILNENVSPEKLKSDIVLCESYGIQYNILPKYQKKHEFNEIKKRIDIPRKTLFKSNIKLTLNADGTVEEFNGNRDDYRELIDYLSIFNVDKYFKIPENEEAFQKWSEQSI